MSAPLTTEQIEAIRAATKNASKGPWRCPPHNWISHVEGPEGEVGSFELIEDAEYIARCDPDTIRSMATELLALREQRLETKDFIENEVGKALTAARAEGRKSGMEMAQQIVLAHREQIGIRTPVMAALEYHPVNNLLSNIAAAIAAALPTTSEKAPTP